MIFVIFVWTRNQIRMGSDIKCPVCGSEQVFASKKGFGTKKAIAGAVLTGDALLSALAGGLGKDRIVITCLKCGHKFSPGDPLSIKHTSFPADTDKFLAENKDLPKTAYYQCACGKISSLETSHPYCPSCGRRLTDNEIVSEEYAKGKSKGGGSIWVILFAILLIGGLIAMVMI